MVQSSLRGRVGAVKPRLNQLSIQSILSILSILSICAHILNGGAPAISTPINPENMYAGYSNMVNEE